MILRGKLNVTKEMRCKQTVTENNRKTDEGKKGRIQTGGHSKLYGRWREGDKTGK